MIHKGTSLIKVIGCHTEENFVDMVAVNILISVDIQRVRACIEHVRDNLVLIHHGIQPWYLY